MILFRVAYYLIDNTLYIHIFVLYLYYFIFMLFLTINAIKHKNKSLSEHKRPFLCLIYFIYSLFCFVFILFYVYAIYFDNKCNKNVNKKIKALVSIRDFYF